MILFFAEIFLSKNAGLHCSVPFVGAAAEGACSATALRLAEFQCCWPSAGHHNTFSDRDVLGNRFADDCKVIPLNPPTHPSLPAAALGCGQIRLPTLYFLTIST